MNHSLTDTVKGSICSFDGMRFHASSTPKTSKRRVVITINYVPQH
jgi:hypothetical protein